MKIPPFIHEDIAKKLKVNPETIKVNKVLAGTSSAKVLDIEWGKEKKQGILKENTTKTEWLFYKLIAKNYDVPAPIPITISDTSEIPWILLNKVERGIHPKKWGKVEVEKAIKGLVKLHATFINKEEEKELEPFQKTFTKDWSKTKRILLENLDKAIKIAANYSTKTPVTKSEFEKVKKRIKAKNFTDSLLTCGTTLLHGETWTYNFTQSKECNCLIDWQECHVGPPAVEIVYFFDLLPFHVEGIKIGLKERPFSFDEIIKMYLAEMRKKGVKISLKDFKVTLQSAVFYQLARQWAPLLKPDVVYLKGGQYFVHRTLRLLPSRREMRKHFKNLLELGE
ncbi:MAG: phosphotransferase [Candidatus Heimdallarchaeaceae archaeon]